MPSDIRMDPHRPPPHSLKRKDRSPSPQDIQPSPSTSLPSIRHLHPYLPPPGPQLQPPYPDVDPRFYSLPGPPSSSSSHLQGGPVTGGPPRYAPHPQDFHPPTGDVYAQQAADSDAEGDLDQDNRPKQKRRRQALSCTECKRRKIKCDRAHPCGPCSRRGDQHKCQWHVIEPVDKYVSRAEYDEVKARVARLEDIIARLPPTLLAASEPPPAPSSSASIPAPTGYPPSLQVHASASASTSAGPSASPRMPTSAPFPHPGPSTSQPSQSRSTYADPPPSFAPYRPPPRPPSAPSDHPHARSPPPFAGKPSSFSLSAITAPFNVPPQPPKNCRAQTFTPLGERLRLRLEATVLLGPAASPTPFLTPTPIPTLSLTLNNPQHRISTPFLSLFVPHLRIRPFNNRLRTSSPNRSPISNLCPHPPSAKSTTAAARTRAAQAYPWPHQAQAQARAHRAQRAQTRRVSASASADGAGQSSRRGFLFLFPARASFRGSGRCNAQSRTRQTLRVPRRAPPSACLRCASSFSPPPWCSKITCRLTHRGWSGVSCSSP